MEIICNKDIFYQAVAPVVYVASAKNTNTAIESLMLYANAEENIVIISGYDLEKGIKITLQNDSVIVRESGELLVTALKFSQIIGNMPDGDISLKTDASANLIIRGGKNESSIHTTDISLFPVLPDLTAEKSFVIKQDAFRSMLSDVLFAVAVNNNRPSYNGALIEIQDGTIKSVGVDGFRLAMRREEGKVSLKNGGMHDGGLYLRFIVPGRSISELIKLLKNNDTDIEIGLSKKQIVVYNENIMFFSRLIDAEFLDYTKSIPVNPVTAVLLNKNSLAECVERAALIMDDKIKSHVKLTFTGGNSGRVEVNAVTAIGKVDDVCDAEIEGPDIVIGFNHKFLLDTLKSIHDEAIVIKLVSPERAAVVVPFDQADHPEPRFLHLVLPVRMFDN